MNEENKRLNAVCDVHSKDLLNFELSDMNYVTVDMIYIERPVGTIILNRKEAVKIRDFLNVFLYEDSIK
ncbi:hypothetical protein [Paenibacillus agilis]|uniref:Uncharacterized protein n=1 Tax=Paenibacillus agilis TaxID=3020863 RepID=A0A559IES9_9BACL|nr:hypothetical protein [Paenibacillus agilis]TVX85973.1 hypothetical protein FPZ44_23765 [Paenibacillus agilis]